MIYSYSFSSSVINISPSCIIMLSIGIIFLLPKVFLWILLITNFLKVFWFYCHFKGYFSSTWNSSLILRFFQPFEDVFCCLCLFYFYWKDSGQFNYCSLESSVFFFPLSDLKIFIFSFYSFHYDMSLSIFLFCNHSTCCAHIFLNLWLDVYHQFYKTFVLFSFQILSVPHSFS